MTVTVQYSSNNSGGSWWLDDDDWKNLEAAGWEVDWITSESNPYRKPDENGRWLGALATGASKEFDHPEDAVKEWSNIVGEDPDAEGCECCGPPHEFFYRDDDGAYFRGWLGEWR